MRIFFTICLLLASSTWGNCQSFSETRIDNIQPYTSVLRDPTGSLSFKEAKTREFKKVQGFLNFGYTTDTIWLRIDIPSKRFSDGQWLLKLGIPYLDSVDFYQEFNGQLHVYRKGRVKSLSQKPYPHRDSIFPVIIGDGTVRFYLRIYSADGTTINASLVSSKQFDADEIKSQLFFGGYFGIMFAMAVYNFCLFIFLRDNRYIYYVIFTLAVMFNAFVHYEFFHEFFFAGNDWIDPRLNIYSFSVAVLASIQFVRSFLSTRKMSKTLDRLFLGFVAVYLIIPLYFTFYPHASTAPFFGCLLPLLTLIGYTGVFALFKRRDFLSRYFIIAFGLFITGVGLFSLRRFGWLPPNPYVNFTFLVGSMMETMLLSFALAHQINILRTQKEASQDLVIRKVKEYSKRLEVVKADLENQVRMRTAKIEHSLNEKDTLLKEVHHRVKNNLAVVSSLLGFQILREPEGSPAAVALRAGCSRIESMAMVHELLCAGDNLAKMSIQDYFPRLLDHLQASYKKNSAGIKVVADLDDFKMPMDMLVPCGLIITELVTNSIKHAFKKCEDGLILLSVRKDGAQVTLTIEDNGMGMSATTVENLGIKLVRMMVEQLDGSAQKEIEGGTRWKMTFSVHEERRENFNC